MIKVSDRKGLIDYEKSRQKDGFFYYTYIILITKGSLKDHYYLGQHRTKNLDDCYRGSGKIIKKYFKKYPNDTDHVFEILKFYKNAEELNNAEKLLVEDRYKNDKLCLNLVPGGVNNTLSSENLGRSHKGQTAWNKGRHWPEDIRQKISKAHMGKKMSPEAIQKMRMSQQKNEAHYRRIIQYSLEGLFINEFKSITYASKMTGIYDKNISACLRGRTRHAGGFVWKYKDPKYLLNLPSNKYP